MSNEKAKSPSPKPQSPAPSPAPAAKPNPTTAVTGKVPALFRRTDWLTCLITFAFVWVGYYLTLAPELTLEDSGELATGSFYAGIPHPPGYPVWTMYTWLWTVLLPVKNIAWRVALGEATGGALATGLLALLVSRGSSLLMEGIEELKAMVGRWESAICMVSGFVAGSLIGFNGFMWSQSVIVEVYAFSMASFMVVLLCLLRWIYAPHQHRYLYFALFFHGICFTNHQTLIVAAMGIEVAIAAASYRMGRYLWLGNSIIFIAGLILQVPSPEANKAIFVIFEIVGVLSIACYLWFSVLTRETFAEFCLDGALAATVLLLAATPSVRFCAILALGSAALVVKFARDTRQMGWEWLVIILCGLCWIAGAGFYFYMPLAGMTNPPMEWGYPRTAEGFIHAFTRGQYEKTNPTDLLHDPGRFFTQLGMLGTGIVEEFNWVYAFLALIPFLFFLKMHKRERAWMIGIAAIYFCMGIILLILLNPPPDRAAQDLVRVFFTASHILIAMLVGYGIALVAAYMATHYQRFRSWGLIGGAIAIALAIFTFISETQEKFFGKASNVDLGTLMSFVGKTFSNKDQYGLPVFAGLILIGLAVVFVGALLLYRKRAPLAISLGMFTLMPLYSIMTHWSDNEQHNHWFGYWFGHDMFTPPFKMPDGSPIYPEMTKDTVLFGGTDPGRFCPTYTIFCESFTPHDCQPELDQKFDRRDVYIITQNALADGTYLNYIRSQYNRSKQVDPPFFRDFFRMALKDPEYQTNVFARAAAPLDRYFTDLGDRIEKSRRVSTSFFGDKDFADVRSLAGKFSRQEDALSKFIYENLSPDTQKILSGQDEKSLKAAISKDLNKLIDRDLQTKKLIVDKSEEKYALEQDAAVSSISERKRKRLDEVTKEIDGLKKTPALYDPERFKDIKLSEYVRDFIKEDPQSHTRVRLNRLLLEEAYPKEIARSLGGVYPDREIYAPTPDDSQRCFQEYLMDAQKRLQANQLKPGEDVRVIENRVQVSGQVAVMAINGLLTKVIFDHNPKNDFYVEESFPLDWMYPYLTPFGIIMKINRNTLPELSEDIVKRDHEFWSQYAARTVGSWITYETSVKEITDFVERVYLRRDFTGFKGDRKFVRDDQAQKAFSKLRSSIGGIYAWRISDAAATRNAPAQQRMIKEADFAFRQAFAFCPYSPEAVFRYVNLLLSLQRFEDAALVASTCLKLDPYNGQVMDLVKRLRDIKGQTQMPMPPENNAPLPSLQQMEKLVKDHPEDLQAAFNLAGTYLSMKQTNQALAMLDKILNEAGSNSGAVFGVVSAYAQIGDATRLENGLSKLVTALPDNPEAWYDLAALKATLGKNQDSVQALSHAFQLSIKRHVTDPKARDLVAEAEKDGRLAAVRLTTEYKNLNTGHK